MGSFVGENVHHYEGISIRLMAYETEIIEGEMCLKDHDLVEWVTVEEMAEYRLAPADIPLVSCWIGKELGQRSC